YYLNIHINELLKGRIDIVVEIDNSSIDSLDLKAIPLSKYRLGRVNTKEVNRIAIYYDNFIYPAKGELAPNILNKLYDGIRMEPKDGQVDDKLIIYIPIELVN